MKKITTLVLLSALFYSCNENKTKNTENKLKNTNKTEVITSISEPDIVPPDLNETYSSGTAQSYLFTINYIDAFAFQSMKKETKITIGGVENTPVIVWYDKNNLPIKAEYGVTSESGEFTGVFRIYFIKGKLWCVDELHAKYIFNENGKLKYWLGVLWEISETQESANFKERELSVLNTVNELLNTVKK